MPKCIFARRLVSGVGTACSLVGSRMVGQGGHCRGPSQSSGLECEPHLHLPLHIAIVGAWVEVSLKGKSVSDRARSRPGSLQ